MEQGDVTREPVLKLQNTGTVNTGEKALQWPIPHLNPTENLLHWLTIAVNKQHPPNLKRLEKIWQEEWTKIMQQKQRANLVVPKPNRLKTVDL